MPTKLQLYAQMADHTAGQITGNVVSVDSYWSLLQIGNISIDFSEIAEIEIIPQPV